MKIALLGHGKMGKLIESLAKERNFEVVAITGSSSDLKKAPIQKADVCIDFSHPDSALPNIEHCIKLKKNIVMGTTGWYDQINVVKEMVKEADIGFLYSPNFSIGIALFLKIVQEACRLINAHPQYDIALFEKHHRQKADSPSGTAKAIASTILSHCNRKESLAENTSRPPLPHELQVEAIRCGYIPGTHTVLIDSPADTLTLSHEARSREGFAIGALDSAAWLHGKKGFFTLDDLLSEVTG